MVTIFVYVFFIGFLIAGDFTIVSLFSADDQQHPEFISRQKKKQNAKQKQIKRSRTKIEICFPNVCRVSSHAQNDDELHFFPSSWKIKMKTKRRTK